MEHALYRLEKTKIAFEHHQLIDSKLCQPTFNYPKFYAISHFIWYIWNYGNAVNYDIAHSEAAHKYLLKAFYNKINKKEYDLQIWQYNVCHTNIIAMKNIIAVADRGEENKELLAIENINKTAIAKVAKVSNAINLRSKYSWAISNADMDTIGNLGLIGIKKY